MSTWTDPETGITIRQTRERRTSETVELRACPEIGDLYLDDLRQLVERCAHLPGDALVQPREGGLEIQYVEIETDRAQETWTEVEDGHVILETGEAIPIGREPTVDGPEDHATDRERDRAVGL